MTSINKTEIFSKNKILATAIILLLIVSMAGALTFAPLANAAQAIPTNVVMHTTYLYCSVASSLLGVGQDQVIAYWTADIPPDTGETDGIIEGAFNRAVWTDVSLNITTPSGVTTNVPIPMGQQDSIGGGYIMYAPTEVGQYTVTAIFPDQWKNSTLIQAANGTYVSTPKQRGYPTPQSEHYTAATSGDVTFEVQQEQIALWNESPMPQDYWTRPINNAARLWSQLGGNWLGGAWNNMGGQAGGTTTRFVYGVGTETSHILWTRSLYAGGYAEARFGDYGYITGHYQGLDFNSLILNGRVYYADRADAYRSIGFNVVDLKTGELLGYYNETMPSYGQLYKYDSPNQHGIYPLLWRSASLGSGNGTSLEMLDGYSLPLRTICYIANASTRGTNVVGNNGELLWYNLVNQGTASNPDYYLTCWNNTNVLGLTATPPNSGTTYWQWRPEGGGFGGGPGLSNAYTYVWDGSTGFSVNASITTPFNTPNAILNQTGTILSVRVGDTNGVGGFVIAGTQGQNNENGNVQGKLWCYSLERGQEGTQLWTSSFTAPYSSIAQNDTTLRLTGVYTEDGVIIFHSTKQLKYWGYDMKTGAPLWEGAREPDQNYYSTQVNYYKGLLLTSGYGGVVIAYNITTGQQAWNFTATNIGGESPYGNYPINIFAIADDKIYTLTGEHSITQPLYRGPNIHCISAADGSEIWSLLGMGADNGAHLTGQYMQFGDGNVVGLNYFDNQIYCIGPGTSATTVTAPQTVPALGSSVTITGTVTDQTKSGRRNMNNLYDFTLEGTPAISDEYMGPWMEYLYENQAKPTDAYGVDVSLSAIDPNGNLVPIGTTTSDMNGNYGIVYTPDVPGSYQIIASFDGSKAYGPSSATTYLTVGEAPVITPGPTETSASAADMYILPATIGIIVALAIATIVIVLALRKRP